MAELQVTSLRFHSFTDVDLRVGAGELVTLGGPSGCGKSLLLRAIVDLDPNEGEIVLGEWRRGRLSAPEWRRQVGLLPAESYWWHDTPGPHFDRIDAGLLEQLGLSEEILGWQVGRLSSGERQRLALARLLVREPAALLLDEPTANLDRENGLRVEALIRDYAGRHGAPVLWVSHDAEQMRRIADRALRFEPAGLKEAAWT